ncbi:MULTISPECIES: DUF5682 family protein [Methylosinus]|uniref:Uncharacterized protein n=1 Tax=Methylosinus trichosporium (strain ATCC 35070 / NCIMB 11131 / UNIQEM 75 / OB3b) TaxID=595536 RepID=A0A2D2D7J1_METT3|nr:MULTISPECIES: DUF5682 family protein [Methylosinus]ATQ70943.1 hypothetical protein CQW49_23625 [Methylosinus trichosporium OB3b]OBS54314.1 hypothetical protein A8B73_01215 [Methylosinus sp. 3S-1]
MDSHLHLLGVRHHGPGSAALLVAALDRLDPAVVLIEGAPEGEALAPHVRGDGLKPPVAMLFYAPGEAKRAVFAPFAEFSPEWQAMRWALARGRPLRFIDWPASVSLAFTQKDEDAEAQRSDPLDLLAEAAGVANGEALWNTLVEESGGASDPVAAFAAIGEAMTEARRHAEESGAPAARRDAIREAFMRLSIRKALQDFGGAVVAIVGAWHIDGLRAKVSPTVDKATIKGLAKVKVEATWAPWTDSRLAFASGYGAGVVSPGWFRHLWRAYREETFEPLSFAAGWQARTATLLRAEGFAASPAAAIEAARLTLSLCGLRDLATPGLDEMRDGALAALCNGDPVPLRVVERRLYIGETIGEISGDAPQSPLARDLALWQKRVRLEPKDIESDIRLDLRTEAGLAKSTLLHRLLLLGVSWGTLIEADAGRGTFREIWRLSWRPEFSVALAEALIYGVTIEEAAGNIIRDRAAHCARVMDMAKIVRASLVADLPDAAGAAISALQALAVDASDLTDLMLAIAPLASALRYGVARRLPEEALRALVHALAVEVNAGVRIGSRQLAADVAAARVAAMRGFDEALAIFDAPDLVAGWRKALTLIVEDEQSAPAAAGFALRRLLDLGLWTAEAAAAAFVRRMSAAPLEAGAFLEHFVAGGAEILLQDAALLALVDAFIVDLDDDSFLAALPLLRRAFSGFDSTARIRLIDGVAQGRRTLSHAPAPEPEEDDPAFAAALPLLLRILGLEAAS